MDQNFIGVNINQYRFIRVIGEGVSSTVYEAFDNKKSIVVAIKVLPKEKVYSHPKYLKLVRTEIAVLKSCSNDNVLTFFESFETNHHVFIVTEFCNGGDLDEFLITKRKLSEEDAIYFLKQIINGFKGLHEVKAMHRDFKTANVLIHNGKNCKIADLGFAKFLERDEVSKTVIGTALTMAPEVLAHEPYGFKADIWSLGVVFYQMLFGKYPFKGKTNSEILYAIKSKSFNFNGAPISDNSKDFIHRCLTVDPVRRISWKKIYSHPLICENRPIAEIKLKSMVSLTGNKEFYNVHSLDGEFSVEKMSICNSEVLNKGIVRIPEKEIMKNFIEPQTAPETPFEAIDEKNIEEVQEEKVKEELLKIVFPQLHINPLVRECGELRINHAVCMFLISKYSYVELLEFEKVVRAANSEQNPEIEILNKDIRKALSDIRITREDYRKSVCLSTLEIQNELNSPERIHEMSAYRTLLSETISLYIESLSSNSELITAKTKSSVKMLIESLEKYAKYLKKEPRRMANTPSGPVKMGDSRGFV